MPYQRDVGLYTTDSQAWDGWSDSVRMSKEYKYAVKPAGEIFNTRHEAVGFAAVHGRKYTYRPMNSIDPTIPLRIEPFSYGGEV